MSNFKKLQAEIKVLEDQLEPKRRELQNLHIQQQLEVHDKIKRALAAKDSFNLEDLIFAATERCNCGAGYAYPHLIGAHGAWYCSDILLGRAAHKETKDGKIHSGEMPFIMWSIKSENQPSASGNTTRPSK